MSSTATLFRRAVPALPSAQPVYVQNSVVYATRRRGVTAGRRLPQMIQQCPVHILGCSVVNLSEPKKVAIYLQVSNATGRAVHGYVRFSVLEQAGGRILQTERVRVSLAAGELRDLRHTMEVRTAATWSLEDQVLYTLNAGWHTQAALHPVEQREVKFAFCEFSVEGTGRDSMFRRLNRGARLGAVMPWGCWGREGLRPIGELTQTRLQP